MKLSSEYLSAFCRQISLLLHAGISIGDGLHMLSEDEEDPHLKELLISLSREVDEGCQISEAMEKSGCFPDHVVFMTRTGEETGRSESAFLALATYYDDQRILSEQVRSALLYPLILLILMLMIIAVLLVKVLPIFDRVYTQLGGSMTGIGAGLLSFGNGLRAALPVIGVIAAVAVAFVLIIYFSDSLRARITASFKRRFGDKGISRKVGMARFASALSMGMKSGLSIEDAMRLSMSFHEDSDKVRVGYTKCLAMLEKGEPLADSLKASHVFPSIYCRMLSLGIKSGAGDDIMAEIAGRLQDDAARSIDRAVGRIEPTLVIVTSVLVGVILLSVMIPLMNIMASIG